MSKPIDATAYEGRGHDGSFYLVELRNGSSARRGDFDGPEAVQARWVQARKDNDVVVFSGARSEAGGQIDGWGTYLASEIVSISNYGAAVVGVTEARIRELEAFAAEAKAAIEEVEGDQDALIDELVAHGHIGSDWAEEDGEPSPPPQTVTVPAGAVPPVSIPSFTSSAAEPAAAPSEEAMEEAGGGER